MTPAPPERPCFLGLPVDAVDMASALARCEAFLSDGGRHQVVTANPLMILAAQDDPELRAAISASDLVVPDGAGLQLVAAFRGRRLARVPGIELMESLCSRAAARGWTVALLGAGEGTAAAAGRALAARHPGLRIVAARHGYFSREEEPGVVREVAGARPDLLFVALSSPFQDAWVHRNLDRLGSRLAMGVGGSFDVLSGRLRRAPSWMRAAGMEWLFRLIQEPGRWRRMTGLPVFLVKSLRRGLDVSVGGC